MPDGIAVAPPWTLLGWIHGPSRIRYYWYRYLIRACLNTCNTVSFKLSLILKCSMWESLYSRDCLPFHSSIEAKGQRNLPVWPKWSP